MEPFTTSFLANAAGGLTTAVLAHLGRRLRERLATPARRQALERCCQAGIAAMALRAGGGDEERRHLEDLLGIFFADEDLGREAAALLRGQRLDREEVEYLFRQAGYQPETLPGFELAPALDDFEAAFVAAALDEPELEGPIHTTQLVAQTGLQLQMVEHMGQMVELLRAARPGGLELRAGRLTAVTVQGEHLHFHLPGAPPAGPAAEGDERNERRDREAALREAYLNRLLEQTGFVPLGGIDPAAGGDAETRLRLSAVYTALLTQSSELGGIEPDEPRAREAATHSRRLSALAQLDRHPRLVLLGDPGSGKSTFANFVTLCLAGELLGRDDAGLDLLTTPLPDGEGKDEEERQPWSHGPLLPVRVVLRDFAARGLPADSRPAGGEDLCRFLAAELTGAALGDFAPLLEEHLRRHGGLLLLDGLDEVPEAERRRQQIRRAVRGFAAAFPRCRLLVTSRTYAYQHQDWRLPGFAEAVLAPFSDGQILRFIERWYTHLAALRGQSTDDARGRAALLRRAIFGSDRLRALAERPLLLALMASLHAWHGGSLPEQREELYARAVDLLLDWWEKRRQEVDAEGRPTLPQPSLLEWLKVDRGRVRGLLHELAFEAHAGQPELEGTADISENDLAGGLLRLAAGGADSPAAEPPRIEQLIRYLRDRAGILLPRGAGVYTFPHRTFQEYLAACRLTDRDFPDQVAALARRDPQRWREVALLAGAKAARGSASSLWRLAETLCPRDPRDAQSEADAWGALLAGQALAEAGIREADDRDHRKLERVRRWQEALLRGRQDTLPAVERAAAGRNLARLGDPRDAVRTVDGMEFCLVPAGDFWMGEGEDAKRHPLPHPLWISRFPVTQAQFREFAADGGYRQERFWGEAAQVGVWEEGKVEDYWKIVSEDGPRSYGDPFDLPNHPAVGVTWYEALAFTRWLDDRLRRRGLLPDGGWQARLPLEREWEKAARGGLEIPAHPRVVPLRELRAADLAAPSKLVPNPLPRRSHPWGDDEPSPEHASYDDTGLGATNAAGCFAAGTSPCGIEELSGGVWEWCLDGSDEDPAAAPRAVRALRGGSWFDPARVLAAAFRFRYRASYRFGHIGFRCVLPVPAEP